jgi:hypothetical protein
MLRLEIIPIGTQVTVRLELDAQAKGPAALVIAWSAGGQTGEHDECFASPGGFCIATVTPAARGLFRIVVDMTSPTDQGRLGVDPVTPFIDLVGDDTCLYRVR